MMEITENMGSIEETCETLNSNSDFIVGLMTALSKVLPTETEQKEFAEALAIAFIGKPNEKYNDDFYFDIVKPTVAMLIRLKEDSAKELRYFREFIYEKQCTNDGTEYATEILESFIEHINDILLNYDVQPFRCEDSRFNPRRQNVVKKLAPEMPEQAKTVAESLGEGYERNGVVIIKERVAAYSADIQEKGGN